MSFGDAFQIGRRLACVSRVENQMMSPIMRVIRAEHIMKKATRCRKRRFRCRTRAGRERAKVKIMTKELTSDAMDNQLGSSTSLEQSIPVSGQWSNSRSEATFLRVGALPMDAWVMRGIRRCKAAQPRKMISKTMKVSRILLIIAAVCVLEAEDADADEATVIDVAQGDQLRPIAAPICK